jgi:hypothetical protein
VRLAAALVVAALVGACHARAPIAPPTTGTIAGLARDRDSGDPIAMAELHLRAEGELATSRVAKSASGGGYTYEHVPPGRYSLTATFAGQPIDVEHIDVVAGQISIVDVTFTLGRPSAERIEWNTHATAIDRYHPRRIAPTVAAIEGTVNDLGMHVAVGGAVVTAIGPGAGPTAATLQTVSDDRGRYRFDAIAPGTYVVSAYYTVGEQAAIEVRRADIRVDAAELVVVPLWIETPAKR